MILGRAPDWYRGRATDIRRALEQIDNQYAGRPRPHEVKLAVIELEREMRNAEIVAEGLDRVLWDAR